MKRLLAALTLAALVLACLAPALAMLRDSLRGPSGGFSLAAYAEVLREERQWTLLARSVAVAGGATLLALVWGVAVAYAVWRLRGWRARVLETLAYLPLLLPSLVLALGWVQGCARVAGWARAAGLGAFAPDLYSPAGAAWLLSLAYFPCVSILALQGLRAVDRNAVRAAQLGAGRAWRLWHFWRPLLGPHLASGALLCFLLAFGDFGVPSVLMVNVYPIEVFTQFSALFDVPAAVASATPAAAVALLLFSARLLLARGAPLAMGAGQGAPTGRTSRALLALAAGALGAALAVPLGFLLVSAGGSYAEALRIAGEQVLTSLWVALLGTAALLGAALASAWALRAAGPRLRALGEAALLLPLLVPGAVLGLGLLALVTRAVWPFAALYPHPAILAYAACARFLPFPALLLAAALAGLRPELSAAARVHGASAARRAGAIVLPLLAPALVSAASLAFVLCLGELPAAVLVSPPGTMTLPVRLASLLHFGQDSIVAALCVMLAGLVGVILLLGILLAGAPPRLRLWHAHRAA